MHIKFWSENMNGRDVLEREDNIKMNIKGTLRGHELAYDIVRRCGDCCELLGCMKGVQLLD